jgi:hypothetical protein
MENSLHLIAGDVAGQFLGGLGSLQDLTREAAESQSLSSNEIERVAQLVNKEVQIRMYAEKGPKGAFEFDMVDPSGIVDSFNTSFADPTTEKVAKDHYEYKKTFADDEETYSGHNQFSGAFLVETKAKLELDLEDMEFEISKTSNSIENGYNEVYGIMKQAVLNEDATIEEVVSFVNQSDTGLTKIAEHIAGNCIKDIIDQSRVPDSMILCKDPIPVDKFEGSQALIKELNTLVQQHSRLEVQDRGAMRMRDTVRYVVEGINSNLKGTINVD